tara:strand:- start:220 stop:654 length:435 start_codon:yes stop_codon:yes gene_type:complete
MIIYFIITIILPVIFLIFNFYKKYINDHKLDYKTQIYYILKKIEDNFYIAKINYNTLKKKIDNYFLIDINILNDIYNLNEKKKEIFDYLESFFILANNNEICFTIKDEFISLINMIHDDKIQKYNDNITEDKININVNKYYKFL